MTVTVEQSNMLVAWQDLKNRIEEAEKTILAPMKKEEKELREAIAEANFDKSISGTTRKPLGNGYQLKAVVKLNYKVDKGPDGTYNHIPNVLAQLPKTMAADIIKWNPELSLTAYNKLTVEEKKILDPILTITNGSSTIEIEPPK